jgi:sortase A
MIGGFFVALALVCIAVVGALALTPGTSNGTTLTAARVRAIAPVAPAVLPAASVPATDAALAAAAWNAEHPPPPPPLPVPAELPDPSAHRDLVDIGRIQIPKTGLDQTVREGIEQMVIDAGPAHWPGTAEFGGWGNVVLAGHRTSHTEPFLRNAELVAGDEILLSDSTGTYHYAVTGVEVVSASALWIKDQHPGRTLTIFTCHPIGSSAERLVVHAELTSRSRTGA